MSEEKKFGYILRVKTDEWVNQIFRLNKYYSGLVRNYQRGMVVLFMAKGPGKLGDCFVGYGVIDKVEMLWEMPPEEEDYARGMGWKVGLSFRGATQFKSPVPRASTPFSLAYDKRTGAFLHGAKLDEDIIDGVLEACEKLQVSESTS